MVVSLIQSIVLRHRKVLSVPKPNRNFQMVHLYPYIVCLESLFKVGILFCSVFFHLERHFANRMEICLALSLFVVVVI